MIVVDLEQERDNWEKVDGVRGDVEHGYCCCLDGCRLVDVGIGEGG